MKKSSRQKKCINFDICGNYKPPLARVSGMCNECASEYMEKKAAGELEERIERNKAKLEESIEELKERIEKFQDYVKDKINYELKENGGKVCCAECGVTITDTFIPQKLGFNVAHIISKGADPSLYFIRENSIILCRHHHMQFDHGIKSEMRVFEETEKMKLEIMNDPEYFKNLEHNKKFYNL